MHDTNEDRNHLFKIFQKKVTWTTNLRATNKH